MWGLPLLLRGVQTAERGEADWWQGKISGSCSTTLDDGFMLGEVSIPFIFSCLFFSSEVKKEKNWTNKTLLIFSVPNPSFLIMVAKGTDENFSIDDLLNLSNDEGSGLDSGSISSSPETNPILHYRRKTGTRGRMPAVNSRSSGPMITDSDSEPGRKGPAPAKRRGLAGEGMKCTHCGTEKTPQWRSGPNGAKSLCNACGVRYKSGRLVPEYRPAASPTFVESKHSNSHRKVMEMRNKKAMMMQNGLVKQEFA